MLWCLYFLSLNDRIGYVTLRVPALHLGFSSCAFYWCGNEVRVVEQNAKLVTQGFMQNAIIRQYENGYHPVNMSMHDTCTRRMDRIVPNTLLVAFPALLCVMCPCHYVQYCHGNK